MTDLLLSFGHHLIWPVLFTPAVFWWKKSLRAAIHITLSIVISWIAGTLLKNFFYLPRPFIATGQPPTGFILDGSLPSNHAAVAFAVAFSTLYYSRPAGLFLAGCALLISASRIYIQVHYPLDVLVGIVLGGSSSWVSRRISSGH